MVYTNIIIKNLEKEYENAKFEVEWVREEENKVSDINSAMFRNFLMNVELFYNNHKKGFVDEVEFDDGMITITKFLALFPNQIIEYTPSARAMDYLLKQKGIETEEIEEVEEMEIPKGFQEYEENINLLIRDCIYDINHGKIPLLVEDFEEEFYPIIPYIVWKVKYSDKIRELSRRTLEKFIKENQIEKK